MALIKHLPGKSFAEETWQVRPPGGVLRTTIGMRLFIKQVHGRNLCATLTVDQYMESWSTPRQATVAAFLHLDGQQLETSESHDGMYYWAFNDKVYVTTDPDLSPEDVLALVNESANRRRLQLEKAHALQSMTADLDSSKQRQAIPQSVKVTVWQRDGGRCVECASNEALEFDHIIPLAIGGANTFRNLQLLCSDCNRRKGATLG